MIDQNTTPDTVFSARTVAWAMLVLAIATISGALLFQYVGKLEPCELCYLERWPYYIGIPVLIVAVALGNRPRAQAAVLAIAGLLFLAGGSVSFYHVGVEQHWFAGPTECTTSDTGATSLEALKAQLLARAPVRCDVVQWSLFGISLAGFNLAASLILALLAVTGIHTSGVLTKRTHSVPA